MLDACLPPTALRDYLAGHTSSELTADIELHIQHCAACQQRLATVDASGDSLVSLLREAAVPHSGEDPLATGVLSAILSYRPSDQILDGVQVPDVGSSISNYRLIEKIGEGGMGTVYLAIHTWLDKPMAVKLLKANRLSDPDAVGRFQREMRAVGKLQHPNIVGAYDAGEENGVPYLAMEYVAGIDVLELVRRIGLLSIPDACEMTRQAALALHHAHQHGLVHRDVKSSNLMLTSDGCIKVLDLGLAQWVLHDDSQLTSDGQVLGTLRYIAPEQLRPGAEVDAASDIYSLGITLCELLLGADVFRCLPIPVDGGSLTSLRPDVPAGLQALIEQMTARRREKRPASMLAVAKALDLYSRPAKLRELTRFCAGSALQPVVHDGLSVALPRQVDNAALATVRIALQSTDVVPPPVAPPPIAPLMSQQVTSASDEPLHMHWPLSLYTLFGAGLATVIVLLAGLTVAFWSMPTKADRARQCGIL